MMYSKYLSSSLLVAVCVATLACSTTEKYPHAQLTINQKIGVYAYIGNDDAGVGFANTLADSLLQTNDQSIQSSLSLLATHKMVLKAVMQSFPTRTNARVFPVLAHQAKYAGQSKKVFDPVATGKSLSLQYIVMLEVKDQLLTTGFVHQEQWRPELKMTVNMIRIKDGQKSMLGSFILHEKPFLKFLSAKEESGVLTKSYSLLAAQMANAFADHIGPVIRTIPAKEKMIHEKIYAFGHIRKLANKDNCIISGDLRKDSSGSQVVYYVPCRDMVLTYACDNDSDKSRCWLQ